MTFEHDPVEIESLALIPIRSGPDVVDGIDGWRLTIHCVTAQAQAPVVRDREQLIRDSKATRARLSNQLMNTIHAAAESGCRSGVRAPLLASVVEEINTGEID